MLVNRVVISRNDHLLVAHLLCLEFDKDQLCCGDTDDVQPVQAVY
jgi:hypothetical protein